LNHVCCLRFFIYFTCSKDVLPLQEEGRRRIAQAFYGFICTKDSLPKKADGLHGSEAQNFPVLVRVASLDFWLEQ
jgi:hypothetical protein